jgi:hypothetical protein
MREIKYGRKVKYILVGTSLNFEIFYLLLTVITGLAPNSSVAGLYVKFVYLNLFGWRGREVHETFFFFGGGGSQEGYSG